MRISRLWGIVLVAVSIIMLTLSGCSQAQPGASSYLFSQQEGIWVSGTGKVSVKPDLATLSLGIEAQESSVSQAQTEASQAMDSLINVIKAQGIADKDIQTQRFSIQQVTSYDPSTQREVVIGYRVTNIVTAKIRSLPQESYTFDYKVGRIIDAVAQAGGDLTRINDLSFSVEDPTQYYDEARTKAVQDAKQTASHLATLNNVTLGKPTFVSEGALSTPPPLLMQKEVTAPAPALETPISPGEIEITLTVQIVYEITR